MCPNEVNSLKDFEITSAFILKAIKIYHLVNIIDNLEGEYPFLFLFSNEWGEGVTSMLKVMTMGQIHRPGKTSMGEATSNNLYWYKIIKYLCN